MSDRTARIRGQLDAMAGSIVVFREDTAARIGWMQRTIVRLCDEVERLESVLSSPAGVGLPGEQETQR